MDNRRQPGAPRREDKKKWRPELLFILSVMALFVFVIIKTEVPQVENWYQRLVNQEQWQAGENCRQAALKAATHTDFARIIKMGAVNPTENGYYVEGVVVGEMGNSGAEVYYGFSCYHKPDGSIVKTHKEAHP